MVLISHDREFLNRQISKVISLEVEGLRTWNGDYEDYRRQRAQEYERLLAQVGEGRRQARAARGVHQPLPGQGQQGQPRRSRR